MDLKDLNIYQLKLWLTHKYLKLWLEINAGKQIAHHVKYIHFQQQD